MSSNSLPVFVLFNTGQGVDELVLRGQQLQGLSVPLEETTRKLVDGVPLERVEQFRNVLTELWESYIPSQGFLE